MGLGRAYTMYRTHSRESLQTDEESSISETDVMLAPRQLLSASEFRRTNVKMGGTADGYFAERINISSKDLGQHAAKTVVIKQGKGYDYAGDAASLSEDGNLAIVREAVAGVLYRALFGPDSAPSTDLVDTDDCLKLCSQFRANFETLEGFAKRCGPLRDTPSGIMSRRGMAHGLGGVAFAAQFLCDRDFKYDNAGFVPADGKSLKKAKSFRAYKIDHGEALKFGGLEAAGQFQISMPELLGVFSKTGISLNITMAGSIWQEYLQAAGMLLGMGTDHFETTVGQVLDVYRDAVNQCWLASCVGYDRWAEGQRKQLEFRYQALKNWAAVVPKNGGSPG